MGKINSYPKDLTVTGNDIWIGSDGDNSLITKNFSPDDLAAYYNSSGIIDGDKSFVHNQMVASVSWTITHNLDKFPSVTVIDSSGSAVIGEVNYSTSNALTLTFSAAFTGVAYLN
jgi:hypothetical protein